MNAPTFISGGYQRILIYLLAVLGVAVIVGASLYPDSPTALGRLVLFGSLFGFILGGCFDPLMDAKTSSRNPLAAKEFSMIAFATLLMGWHLQVLSGLLPAYLYVGALVVSFFYGRHWTTLKALMADSKHG